MARILQVVTRNKADKIYRFINYIVDFILSIFILWILIAVYALLKYFISGVELEQTAYELEQVNGFIDRVLTILAYAFIMFLTEKITNGRSLGKLLTGTKVVKTDGSPLTTDDLLKRNFSRAVPFDGFSFLGNNGWHDSWSDTRVVRIKDYEAALKLEKDMEMLGAKENL